MAEKTRNAGYLKPGEPPAGTREKGAADILEKQKLHTLSTMCELYNPDFISFLEKFKFKQSCPFQIDPNCKGNKIGFLKLGLDRQLDMHDALCDAERKVLSLRKFLPRLTTDKIGTDRLKVEEDDDSTYIKVVTDKGSCELCEYIRYKCSEAKDAEENLKKGELSYQQAHGSTDKLNGAALGYDRDAISNGSNTETDPHQKLGMLKTERTKQEILPGSEARRLQSLQHEHSDSHREARIVYLENVDIPQEQSVYVKKFFPGFLEKNTVGVEYKISSERIELSSFSKHDLKQAYYVVEKRMKAIEVECVPFYDSSKRAKENFNRFCERISEKYNCIIAPVVTATSNGPSSKQFVPVIHHFQNHDVHLYLLEGNIDNICLQTTIYVTSEETDPTVRKYENEKKVEVGLTPDMTKREIYKYMNKALSWAKSNSSAIGLVIGHVPHALSGIAEAIVFLCERSMEAINVYLLEPERKNILHEFESHCKVQKWKEVQHETKEDLEWECKEREIPNYEDFALSQNFSVHVDEENQIKSLVPILMCLPITFKDISRPHLQAHCPQHRKLLEKKVQAKVREKADLQSLDSTVGIISVKETGYLLYYAPRWEFGAGQVIARAVNLCVEKAKEYDCSVVFVPPGISSEDTFKYPPRFLAQQVFHSLDNVLLEQGLKYMDIHLRVHHSPYKEAFKAEMDKRKPSFAKKSPSFTEEETEEKYLQVVGWRDNMPQVLDELKLKMPPAVRSSGLSDWGEGSYNSNAWTHRASTGSDMREDTERERRDETERKRREETEKELREETERKRREEETEMERREEAERKRREETERELRGETERKRREEETEMKRREEAERERREETERESKNSSRSFYTGTRTTTKISAEISSAVQRSGLSDRKKEMYDYDALTHRVSTGSDKSEKAERERGDETKRESRNSPQSIYTGTRTTMETSAEISARIPGDMLSGERGGEYSSDHRARRNPSYFTDPEMRNKTERDGGASSYSNRRLSAGAGIGIKMPSAVAGGLTSLEEKYLSYLTTSREGTPMNKTDQTYYKQTLFTYRK